MPWLHNIPTPAGRVNPSLPPELDNIIGKLLEKDADLRYQTAGDLRADLKRLHRDTTSGRSVAATGAISAAGVEAPVAVAGIGGYYFAIHGKQSAPAAPSAPALQAPAVSAPQTPAASGQEPSAAPAATPPVATQPRSMSSAPAAAIKKPAPVSSAPMPSKPVAAEPAIPNAEPPAGTTADTATTNTASAAKGGPCEKVKQACLDAGFVWGSVKRGKGLFSDCAIPLVQGTPQPANAVLPLPQLAPGIAAACKTKNPNYGNQTHSGGSGSAPPADSTPAH